MLPLVIVGACLFGFGTYQAMKPKDPEVNTGFIAPADNPRTMQAPAAPPVTKDAAQKAAEASDTTVPTTPSERQKEQPSIANVPWLKTIMAGAFGNFREGVLTSLKAEQTKGAMNCAPALTDMPIAGFIRVATISCTTKDGGQISGDFDEAGEGDLKVEYGDGAQVRVSKNEGDFNVETRNAR